MSSGPEEGGYFRRNYLREPVLLADSVRARRRLVAWFAAARMGDKSDFAEQMERMFGVAYPISYNHSAFWEKEDIADILSGITLWLKMNGLHNLLLAEARAIIAEESLRYRIDDKGGVHFFVDEEFERAIQSTMAGLGSTRFTAANHALQDALSNLDVAHQSGKGLISGIFEAVESAFITIIGPTKIDRISPKAIDDHLRPKLLNHFSAYPEAGDKVDRLLGTFKAWVHSAHPFRHGAGFDQAHEAPLDLAIATATQGMSFLRLIVAL
ncbi:hypothetical protein [Mesorhizobium sp. B4-1-4]|uniref:hypothetical protein n=1 Tax=Mesorhizobium sp. B4-1-4 TaxID=2589888 RepID=UPI001128ED05|nr:hypothetical protein [Mesorhizobium sp. B4-1-4]UCI33560.1 hypothetical protein FJW03_09105 [Mesorhizobium sp. B4-1-4]